MKSSKIGDRLLIGEQPTERDLAELAAVGVRAVVDLRREGEANQPLGPREEAAAAAAAGLAHHHIPVATSEPQPGQVEAVRAAIEGADGPVYVHCGMGQRAGALALMALAPGAGLTAEDVFARARDSGFPITAAGLADFIRRGFDRGF